MRYHVEHTTIYRYSEPASLGHNATHLAPRSFPQQRCLFYRLAIEPAPRMVRSHTDYFGNQVDYFTLEDEHTDLTITASSEVDVRPPEPPAAELTPAWETVRDRLAGASDDEALAAVQFTFDSPCVRGDDVLADYAVRSFPPGRPLLAAALDLTLRIHREFKYDPSATAVNTPTREVFEKRRGVCQDFAHLEIACLRALGLAARYVSGYLLTDPPAGRPRLIGADASHAWLSIFSPGYGWVDLDPTNNQIPEARHVTLGWGRDYRDVAPIQGVFLGGGQHTMSVAVDVVPAAS